METEKCWLYDGCNHKDCESDFCLKKYKLELLYKESLLSEKQRKHVVLCVDSTGVDLEAFKQLSAIEKDITQFVADGKSLFIHSAQVGNGKSSWSIRMIQAYFNKIWPKAGGDCNAIFISVPEFLIRLKHNISHPDEQLEQILNNVKKADLVVWDDIGAKMGSEFEVTQLHSIIDSRIYAGKANIYTANVCGTALSTAVGDRLASRIEQYSICIELKGGDKRNWTIGENE